MGFRVYNAGGQRVGPSLNWESRFGCIGRIDNSISPRGERSYTFAWTPIENYGIATTSIALPPGRYTVLGGLRSGDALRLVSQAVALEVGVP